MSRAQTGSIKTHTELLSALCGYNLTLNSFSFSHFSSDSHSSLSFVSDLFLSSFPPFCLFVRVDKIRFSFMLYHKSPIKSFLCAQSCKSAVLIALSLGQRVQNSGTFRRWIYLTLLYPVPGHPLYLLSLSLRSPSQWLVSTPVFSHIVVCSLKLTFFSPICLHSVFLQHHFHFSCTLFLDCRFSHPLPSLPSCCPAFQILVPSYHSLPSSSFRDGLETPHHSVIPLPLL